MSEDNGEDILTCPNCGHEQDEAECFIGMLGNLRHYRCRYCGSTFTERLDG